MEDAGLLQHGETPDGEYLVKYGNRLLDLINFWQTKGLKLWLQQDLVIPLVQGTSLYVLGPTGNVPMVKPTRVIQAYLTDPSGFSTINLNPLARYDWSILPNKTQQGMPNSYYVDKQQLSLNVNLWLTPDSVSSTYSLHAVVQNQVVNFTNLTDTINFPVEWFLALRWGLAADICTGQPAPIIQRCEMKAAQYLDALENWDVEDTSVMFQPDPGYQNNTTRFS